MLRYEMNSCTKVHFDIWRVYVHSLFQILGMYADRSCSFSLLPCIAFEHFHSQCSKFGSFFQADNKVC